MSSSSASLGTRIKKSLRAILMAGLTAFLFWISLVWPLLGPTPWSVVTQMPAFTGPASPDYVAPEPGSTPGGGNGGATPSPSPSTYTPEQQAARTAAATSLGTSLTEKGYNPVAVFHGVKDPQGHVVIPHDASDFMVGANSGHQGALVLFQKPDAFKDAPVPGIDPGVVVMVDSGTASDGSTGDGDAVAYAQIFSDGRGTICPAQNEKIKLDDAANWYDLNKAKLVRNGGLGTRALLNHDDVPTVVPAGEELTCFLFDPRDEAVIFDDMLTGASASPSPATS